MNIRTDLFLDIGDVPQRNQSMNFDLVYSFLNKIDDIGNFLNSVIYELNKAISILNRNNHNINIHFPIIIDIPNYNINFYTHFNTIDPNVFNDKISQFFLSCYDFMQRLNNLLISLGNTVLAFDCGYALLLSPNPIDCGNASTNNFDNFFDYAESYLLPVSYPPQQNAQSFTPQANNFLKSLQIVIKQIPVIMTYIDLYIGNIFSPTSQLNIQEYSSGDIDGGFATTLYELYNITAECGNATSTYTVIADCGNISYNTQEYSSGDIDGGFATTLYILYNITAECGNATSTYTVTANCNI